MKHPTATGLHPAPQTQLNTTALPLVLARALPAALTFAGLWGTACRTWGFAPAGQMWAAGLIGLAALLLGVLALSRVGWQRWLYAGAALAAAAFCLLLLPQVRGGAAALWNAVLTREEVRQSRIFLRLTETGAAPLFAAAPLCVLLGLALAAAAHWFAPACAIAAACVLVLIPAGLLDVSAWLPVLLLGGAFSLTGSAQDRDAIRARFAAQGLLLAGAALIVGLFAAVLRWSPDLAAQKTALEDTVHRLRYESAAQPRPEGDWTDRSARPDAQESMLNVTLSRPESLYLRTFTGAQYGPDGWQAEDRQTLAEQADLFYWLQKNGFFAQSQLSTLAGLVNFEADPLEVTLEYTGACRRNAAIPYELTADNSILTTTQLSDAELRNPGLRGRKTVTYTTDSNLVSHAYELLELLEERLDDEALADYRAQETLYRAYVYDTALTVPAETAETIAEFLGEKKDTMTSFEAKNLILNCLNETAEYTDAPQLPPEDEDFVRAFLRELGGGDDVSYATAAVMMLRYFGIPARYAEGYLITPQAVENAGDGPVTVQLTAADAHAWAEYYEDGVGWVPFETCPPYLGVMAESDWRWFAPDADAQLESSSGEEGMLGTASVQTRRPDAVQEEQEQPEQSQTEASTSREQTVRRKRLGLLLLVLLALLLIAAVIFLIVRRRRTLQARQAKFDQPDAGAASAAMFAYGMHLMWASGLPRRNCPAGELAEEAAAWSGTDDADRFRCLAAHNDEALFSAHTLDESRRTEMREFYEAALPLCKSKLKFWQRWYQKWLRCLY